jgi:hypothetical protein
MEMEQMMVRLLAEIRISQEYMKEMVGCQPGKGGHHLKDIKEDMKANQAKTDTHREADREHMQQLMTKIETD